MAARRRCYLPVPLVARLPRVRARGVDGELRAERVTRYIRSLARLSRRQSGGVRMVGVRDRRHYQVLAARLALAKPWSAMRRTVENDQADWSGSGTELLQENVTNLEVCSFSFSESVPNPSKSAKSFQIVFVGASGLTDNG